MTTELPQTMLSRLTAIMESLVAVQTNDELADALQKILVNTVTGEYLGIFLMDFGTNKLRIRHTTGFTPEEREEAERTAWDRHPGWVIRNKQMLHIRDTRTDHRSQTSKRAIEVRSRLWLPIISENEAIGAIALSSSVVDAYSDEQVDLVQYAAKMAGFMYANLRDKWKLEEQFILAEEQRLEMIALSSPLVEVGRGIIVLPIIGRMDEQRAAQMTEKLLETIVSRSVRAVILDLTGVATIDSISIETLGRLHRAVRLLGSDCVFTGISGQTAALMTTIGQDLGGWTTFATVRQALASFLTGSHTAAKKA